MLYEFLFSSVFDFLTPATPRSAKLFGGASRDLDSDRFARLSPRHSPRIELPDTPTDLSCGRGQNRDIEVDEAAEDLSMASKIAKVSRLTPPPPLQCLEPPIIKQEYSRPSSVKQEYHSRYCFFKIGFRVAFPCRLKIWIKKNREKRKSFTQLQCFLKRFMKIQKKNYNSVRERNEQKTL